MMDPLTGLNRGYCFVTFVDKSGAQEAVKQVSHNIFDGFILKMCYLKCVVCCIELKLKYIYHKNSSYLITCSTIYMCRVLTK